MIGAISVRKIVSRLEDVISDELNTATAGSEPDYSRCNSLRFSATGLLRVTCGDLPEDTPLYFRTQRVHDMPPGIELRAPRGCTQKKIIIWVQQEMRVEDVVLRRARHIADEYHPLITYSTLKRGIWTPHRWNTDVPMSHIPRPDVITGTITVDGPNIMFKDNEHKTVWIQCYDDLNE